jgi:hypothetical protein
MYSAKQHVASSLLWLPSIEYIELVSLLKKPVLSLLLTKSKINTGDAAASDGEKEDVISCVQLSLKNCKPISSA